MYGRDILYLFKRCSKTADAADIILHENHGGLWVRINDFFDRHFFGNLVFTHDFTFLIVPRNKHPPYKDSYSGFCEETGRWDPAKKDSSLGRRPVRQMLPIKRCSAFKVYKETQQVSETIHSN